MLNKFIFSVLVSLSMAVAVFPLGYTDISGSVVYHDTPANGVDTLSGVRVDFITTTPTIDTFTTWTTGYSFRYLKGSYYSLSVPLGCKGYLTFNKEHFSFKDSLENWPVGTGTRTLGFTCTTAVKRDVIAYKRLWSYGVQIWLRDSCTRLSGFPQYVLPDSESVNKVVVTLYKQDSVIWVDTTRWGGCMVYIGYPSDWVIRMTVKRDGFTFVPRPTWIDSSRKIYQMEAFIQQPVKVSPTSGNLNAPTSTVISWGSVPFATKYTIQVSTLPGFSTTILSKDTNVTSITLALQPGTKYYWRVRTKIDENSSIWVTDSFTIAQATGTLNKTTIKKTQVGVWAGVLSYTLETGCPVEIRAYDLQGNQLMSMVQSQSPGAYCININYKGYYVVMFKAGTYQKTIKASGPL